MHGNIKIPRSTLPHSSQKEDNKKDVDGWSPGRSYTQLTQVAKVPVFRSVLSSAVKQLVV